MKTSPSSVSRLVEGRYDEGKVRAVAQELRLQLGVKPTVAFVFTTEDYQDHWSDFSETLRVHGHVPLLVGTTAPSILGTGVELEGGEGFSVIFFNLPGTKVEVVQVTNEMVETEGGASYWHEQTGLSAQEPQSWIACVECVRFQVETWLNQWNEAFPGIPVIGGLVGGESRIYLNEESVHGGALLSMRGESRVSTVISQGCKPIGLPFTVTAAEQNVLYSLGSLPAYQVLNDAFEHLTAQEKERARGNLFAGLAMSEYVEEFKRGDFLVRHILGADPSTGAVALGALPRVGQTLQYQLRDRAAASDELTSLLFNQQALLAEKPPLGALMFNCSGRGKALFGESHHDVNALDRAFPKLPVAGFFAAGEIGPVENRNYIHSYTASIGLIHPM